MAYTVTYDGDFLFDPYGDDVITDSSISGEVNAAVYFDFTIASNHRLYNKLEEKAGIVRVYSDSKLLFMGEITDIQEDFYGSKQVSCVDPRDHLNDVLLRPYSTVSGEQSITAPSSVDGYFQWLIDKYNEGMINPKFHFQVGVNQGAYLEKNNYIYRSSEQFPSVGSELEDKILDTLGGYLTLTYPDDIPTLNLYADVHEANTQMIDFGVNLIDFTKTTGTSEQYTAIRPQGGTPEKDSDDPDAPDPEPTTIESLGDGVTSVDSDYVKKGDVVYCQSAVNRYGYKEYNWSESDTTDPNDLLEKAVADLKKKVEPKLTLEVKAVDMALFMEGYDHLECGQVARVRSKPHGVDEYLLVSSMGIDLQDPSQTKYTLGQAYDSLTGEQSSFVKSLNAGINGSLDAVAGLTQDVKDQAVLVGQAVSDASNAVSVAGEAQNTANGAQQAAQNAQQAAQNAQNSADQALEQVQGVGDLVDQVQEMVDSIDADVEGAKQQASEAAQRADEASKKADAAAEKADSFQQQITDVTTTVNGVEQNVTELSTQVSGAVENANEALTQVSQTKTDLDGFKASVSQIYTTKDELDDAIAQEVLDRNAAIEVGIDGISATVSSNYTELTGKVNEVQDDLDVYKDTVSTTYATKSSVNQTTEEIRAEVEKTYQVKGDYLTEGQAAQVYATKTALTQTSDSITAEVAKTYQTKSGMSSYATKSYVEQQDNSIKSEVAATYTTKTEFNGLEIGGRNLLLGTAYENLSHVTVRGGYGTVSMDTSDTVGSRTSLKLVTTQVGASGTRGVMHDLVPKLENKKVVVSFWVKGSVAASMMVRIGGGYTAGSTAMDKAVTTSWSRVVLEMGPLNGNGSSEPYVIIAFNKAGTFRVSGMKCEYGNRATDWSPAPEDMATTDYVQTTYATKTALKQTENSITASVEAKYLSKTDASSTYATKTQLEQTEDSITTTVSQVQTIADNAFAKASQVEQTAEGLQVTLTEVEATANTAKTNASTALSTANSAKTTATNAQNTANTANTLSGRASQTYSFGGSSSAAWVRLGTLKTGTSNTVEIVVFAGIGYNGKASQNSKISIVIRDGNHTGDAANRYGVTVMREGYEANEVQVRSSAYGTAEVWVHFIGAYANGSYSISKASNVTWTHSGTVQTAAPTAGTVQDQSYLTNAAAAAKTATNYLKFDSSGLCVGNMTTGTLGYNTLVKSTGVDIRNGSTVLSSFGASRIGLGNNSSSSQIKMCGNVGTILTKTVGSAQSITLRTSNANRYMYTGTNSSGIRVDDLNAATLELWHQSANDLAIRMRARTIEVEGTTDNRYYANIELKYLASLLGNNNNHVPAHIRCGTKVVTVAAGSDSAVVWSLTSFQNEMGFQFNATDTSVVFMNGDGAANGKHVEGSTYLNGSIYVVLNGVVSRNTSTRINYIACKNEI